MAHDSYSCVDMQETVEFHIRHCILHSARHCDCLNNRGKYYGLQTQNKSRKEISGALLPTSITRIALLVYCLLVCSAELFQL